jgi:hypothetical protein
MADNDIVFVAGRSRDRAQALLAAADKIGADRTRVRAIQNGYHVPREIAEEFLGKKLKDEKAPSAPEEQKAPEAPEEAPEEPAADVPDGGDDVEDEAEEIEQPRGNASLQAWIDFAVTLGYDPSRGLTRNELVEEYGQN